MSAPAHIARENGKKGGRPKGTLDPHTKTKELVREACRLQITSELPDIIRAQIKRAKGLSYLVTRDERGKFIKVTEAMARAWKKKGEHPEIIEVWEKEPCTQSATNLMAYAIDRPKEQELDVNVNGNWNDVVATIVAARKRNAAFQAR